MREREGDSEREGGGDKRTVRMLTEFDKKRFEHNSFTAPLMPRSSEEALGRGSSAPHLQFTVDLCLGGWGAAAGAALLLWRLMGKGCMWGCVCYRRLRGRTAV